MCSRSRSSVITRSRRSVRILSRGISRRGYAPGYLQELYFTGPPYENVTRDVLSGKAAAGILPACVLEALDRQKKISLSDFRIINPRRETELQCSHSTDVFPSLTVASLQNTQKTMATALYLMPHTGKEAQWALPASMQSVLDVFYRLKIGPYQYLAQWSIQRFVKENAAEVAVALIFILMVVSYAAVLQCAGRPSRFGSQCRSGSVTSRKSRRRASISPRLSAPVSSVRCPP
jgi:two-component system sensor histidine kinase TtrS